MRNLIITLVILVAGMVWFRDWAGSGEMDNFIRSHSDAQYTPDVIYFLGDFCRTIGEEKTAAYYYRWLFEKYPRFGRTDKVLYRLGRCYEEMGRRAEAIEQYKIVISSYPRTETAHLSQKAYDKLRY